MVLATLSVAIVTLAFARCGRPRVSTRDAARTADRISWATLVGCWALYDSAGRRANETLYWAPFVARLDSAAPLGVRALRPRHHPAYKLDSLGRRDTTRLTSAGRLLSTWSTDSLADTVRIAFNSGYSGTILILGIPKTAKRLDTLRGRALEFWDAGPAVTPAGGAHAVRVACKE
jgi:hypothetical protein